MSNEKVSIRQRAYALHYDWVLNQNGDVWLRPIFWDEPCHYLPFPEALARLRQLEAKAGYNPEDESGDLLT